MSDENGALFPREPKDMEIWWNFLNGIVNFCIASSSVMETVFNVSPNYIPKTYEYIYMDCPKVKRSRSDITVSKQKGLAKLQEAYDIYKEAVKPIMTDVAQTLKQKSLTDLTQCDETEEFVSAREDLESKCLIANCKYDHHHGKKNTRHCNKDKNDPPPGTELNYYETIVPNNSLEVFEKAEPHMYPIKEINQDNYFQKMFGAIADLKSNLFKHPRNEKPFSKTENYETLNCQPFYHEDAKVINKSFNLEYKNPQVVETYMGNSFTQSPPSNGSWNSVFPLNNSSEDDTTKIKLIKQIKSGIEQDQVTLISKAVEAKRSAFERNLALQEIKNQIKLLQLGNSNSKTMKMQCLNDIIFSGTKTIIKTNRNTNNEVILQDREQQYSSHCIRYSRIQVKHTAIQKTEEPTGKLICEHKLSSFKDSCPIHGKHELHRVSHAMCKKKSAKQQANLCLKAGRQTEIGVCTENKQRLGPPPERTCSHMRSSDCSFKSCSDEVDFDDMTLPSGNENSDEELVQVVDMVEGKCKRRQLSSGYVRRRVV